MVAFPALAFTNERLNLKKNSENAAKFIIVK